MEKGKLLTFVVIGLIVAALGAPAFGGESSVELGKQLFADPTLGGSTNDKSCETCHPAGKKLENAASNKKLADMINRCITGPLEGSKIDGRSVEMRSLKLYIQSLGKTKP